MPKRKPRRKVVNVRGPGKGHNSGTSFGFYPSYLFKVHDPILDSIDRLFEIANAKGVDTHFTNIAELSHVSAGTLSNWRSRKTKKPQNATISAVINSLGGELTVVHKGRILHTSIKIGGDKK